MMKRQNSMQWKTFSTNWSLHHFMTSLSAPHQSKELTRRPYLIFFCIIPQECFASMLSKDKPVNHFMNHAVYHWQVCLSLIYLDRLCAESMWISDNLRRSPRRRRWWRRLPSKCIRVETVAESFIAVTLVVEKEEDREGV